MRAKEARAVLRAPHSASGNPTATAIAKPVAAKATRRRALLARCAGECRARSSRRRRSNDSDQPSNRPPKPARQRLNRRGSPADASFLSATSRSPFASLAAARPIKPPLLSSPSRMSVGRCPARQTTTITAPAQMFSPPRSAQAQASFHHSLIAAGRECNIGGLRFVL
jgi:hypothetical protein